MIHQILIATSMLSVLTKSVPSQQDSGDTRRRRAETSFFTYILLCEASIITLHKPNL